MLNRMCPTASWQSFSALEAVEHLYLNFWQKPVSKAMLFRTANIGSDCRSWKYVMNAMHHWIFACAPAHLCGLLLLFIKQVKATAGTIYRQRCWLLGHAEKDVRCGLKLFQSWQHRGGPSVPDVTQPCQNGGFCWWEELRGSDFTL